MGRQGHVLGRHSLLDQPLRLRLVVVAIENRVDEDPMVILLLLSRVDHQSPDRYKLVEFFEKLASFDHEQFRVINHFNSAFSVNLLVNGGVQETVFVTEVGSVRVAGEGHIESLRLLIDQFVRQRGQIANIFVQVEGAFKDKDDLISQVSL